MIEGQKLRRRNNLRRAIYEWGAIGFGVLSLACLVYWIILSTSSMAELEPLWMPGGIVVSANRGSVLLTPGPDKETRSADVFTRNSWHGWETISDYKLDLPGIRFRLLRFWLYARSPQRVARATGALQVSLLFPCVISAILGFACINRYRALACRPISENLISDRPTTH